MLFFLALGFQSFSYCQISWNCDPLHSTIQFKTTHMGLVEVWGKFTKYETNFIQKIAGSDLTNSSFTVEIQTGSVDTDIEARDTHLKSKDFLDATNFPEMLFVSKFFKKKRDGKYELNGTLTIKGVSKAVTIQTKSGKIVTDLEGKKRIGFSGTVSVNRKDFGITFNAPMDNGEVLIGELIDIFISMEFIAAD
jgi:polyisoprenoid-binding protein YceI